MAVDRIKRINELIRREIAASLFHVGQGEGAEVGRISIVDVDVSRDLRNASVQVSIMGTNTDSEALMKWLRRHRVDFQTRIAKSIAIKYTPKLFFRQTQSIEKGDRVLSLLNEILPPTEDGEHAEDGGTPPEPTVE